MGNSVNSIQQQLQLATQRLSESPSAKLDAYLLLAHCVGKSTTFLRTWPETELTDAQLSAFQHLIDQRQAGHPVAHLLGYRDFWTLSLEVSSDTLIPRPETELLVELALALALPPQAKVLDLGTGTGAIALALAAEKPNWQIMGVDKSPAAVSLAKRNASKHGLSRVQFSASDWFTRIESQAFDLIVTNPPYVESDSEYLQQGDVRFEPRSALTAGKTGLDDIAVIVPQSQPFLAPHGWLLIEHGHTQGEAIRQLLSQQQFSQVRTVADLNGLDRVTMGQR